MDKGDGETLWESMYGGINITYGIKENGTLIETVVTYDEIEKLKEQENEMELVNTKVFEYCIINFHDDGAPEVVVGPEVIATLGEENPRDATLLRIGRRHADIINDDSEVQIRPFC